MKLTKEDVQMFENLAKTQTGKQLIEYCRRLSDYICDSRNWDDTDNREHVTKAASIIEKNIAGRISLTNKPKAGEVNPFV